MFLEMSWYSAVESKFFKQQNTIKNLLASFVCLNKSRFPRVKGSKEAESTAHKQRRPLK